MLLRLAVNNWSGMLHIQQGAAYLPRDVHQVLAIPPRVTFLKSLLIAVFVLSCYSGTSLIRTSNIHLLGLHDLNHCAFYLTLMVGREQDSYARSFEGKE